MPFLPRSKTFCLKFYFLGIRKLQPGSLSFRLYPTAKFAPKLKGLPKIHQSPAQSKQTLPHRWEEAHHPDFTDNPTRLLPKGSQSLLLTWENELKYHFQIAHQLIHFCNRQCQSISSDSENEHHGLHASKLDFLPLNQKSSSCILLEKGNIKFTQQLETW